MDKKCYSDYTDYPEIFSNTYWGDFQNAPDEGIIKNRNNFIKDYKIKEYKFGAYKGDSIMLNQIGVDQTRKYAHLEYYITHDGANIVVISPYGSQEFISENEDNVDNQYYIQRGWTKIPKLYSQDANTYIKKIYQNLKDNPKLRDMLSIERHFEYTNTKTEDPIFHGDGFNCFVKSRIYNFRVCGILQNDTVKREEFLNIINNQVILILNSSNSSPNSSDCYFLVKDFTIYRTKGRITKFKYKKLEPIKFFEYLNYIRIKDESLVGEGSHLNSVEMFLEILSGYNVNNPGICYKTASIIP